DTSNPFKTSFDAAFKTAWAGFRHCGEFTLSQGEKFSPMSHLTQGCVAFLPSFEFPSHVRIDLPTSKTDPFCKGVSILLAKAPSLTCPVTALHNLFLVDQKPHDAPLFTNLDGSPLSHNMFISLLKQHLLHCNIDPMHFSGHSFCWGVATAAAAVGYTEHKIQLLGRWRSDAYKVYIDVLQECMLSLSSRLHLATSHAHNFAPLSLLFAPPMA
ncbi:hypothetical protein J132_09578, partial [Termitomyces sp. J132]